MAFKKSMFSTTIIALLLTSTLLGAFNIQPAFGSGTIYIRADGSIDPPTEPIIRVGNSYTLTSNIRNTIVVQRNNIIIDGADYTLQGYGGKRGLYLDKRENITIQNITIKGFERGISLHGSSHIKIFGSAITSNSLSGIYLSQSSNNVITGNNISGSHGGPLEGYGIYLGYSNHNLISGNNIRYNNMGIDGRESRNNSISGNNITNNDVVGIHIASGYSPQLGYSNHNNISGNNIKHNDMAGIQLYNSHYNNVSGNNITNNGEQGEINTGGIRIQGSSNAINGNDITANGNWGIYLASSDNIVSKNTIAKNYNDGIFCFSNNNIIIGNTIAHNNNFGIYIVADYHKGNTIHHNNFVGKKEHAYSKGKNNAWDNGYPSGGNYWGTSSGWKDEYSGRYQSEPGSDGIRDTPHGIRSGAHGTLIDSWDRYPLMAPITIFDELWNGVQHSLGVLSNSKVSSFQLDADQKTLSFNVSGAEVTAGFCRITIPNTVVQEIWDKNYTVLLNGVPQPFANWTDTINTYIYINYTHSEHEIIIIPEFPQALILPLLMVLSAIAVVLANKKRLKKTQALLPVFP